MSVFGVEEIMSSMLIWCCICEGIVLRGKPYFNPHICMGCDKRPLNQRSSRWNFNPHTRTGCDDSLQSAIAIYRIFQSTHPHGV